MAWTASPDREHDAMKLQGGPNIYGVTIGVLCLDSHFPKPPGHIKNPSGLSFPVLYETVPGATVAKLVNGPPPDFIEPFLEAARRLEAEGARAITGSCGFFALFQRQLAEAVSVPMFAYSLIQVPLVHHHAGRPRQGRRTDRQRTQPDSAAFRRRRRWRYPGGRPGHGRLPRIPRGHPRGPAR